MGVDLLDSTDFPNWVSQLEKTSGMKISADGLSLEESWSPLSLAGLVKPTRG